MAKLTLNDITAGYASATLYNDNNALIEAALENTLSRDGTTPNTMSADFDMNSNDINNVAIINATTGNFTSMTLNGSAITTTTTLTGGLLASEVTYDGGDLDTKLGTDFLKTTGNYTTAGNITFNGDNTHGGDITLNGLDNHAAQLHFESLGSSNNWLGFDSRNNADGTAGSLIQWDSGFAGHNFSISRNVQYGSQFGRTGDGACLIGFDCDTIDGWIYIDTWDKTGHVAGDPLGTANARYLQGDDFFRWIINGTQMVQLNAGGITSDYIPAYEQTPLSFNAEVNDGVLTSSTSTVTYSTQNAYWTQIAKMVFFEVDLQLSSLGNLAIGANSVRILLGDSPGGDQLPTPARDGACSVMCQNLDTASFLATDAVVGLIQGGVGASVLLQNYSTTAGCTPLTTDELTTNTIITLSGHYLTA